MLIVTDSIEIGLH